MSPRILRAALTQTKNVYAPMPDQSSKLSSLAGHLEEIREANLAHHLLLLQEAVARGARLVGFGELFPAPYFALEQRDLWRALAEDARQGPTITRLRSAARERGVILVAPIYEREPQTGRFFNTAVVLDEEGKILGSYRKNHIPAGRNEQGSFHETFYYECGDGRQQQTAANLSSNPHFPVFQTSTCRLGVAICYDRHFEGVMSTLAKQGAELVLCPSVTFGQESRRLWQLESATDAARHQLYIGLSNRAGAEPPYQVAFFGESHFTGPQGPLPNLSDHPELILADLDLEALGSRNPSGWNLLHDRRPEIYSPRSPIPRSQAPTFKFPPETKPDS